MAGVALLLLAAWGWITFTRGPIHRGNVEALQKAVKPGMTEAEVEAILGGRANFPKIPEYDEPIDFTTANFIRTSNFAIGLRVFPSEEIKPKVMKAWGEDYRCGITVYFDERGRVDSCSFWEGPGLWQRMCKRVGLK